ncbi:hypothetical protein [Roseomonas elaeocarpi]|uniref:Uncharacterized protein n=1 Tax=Roseomonas elaeocarpi TaxID=907779 RepID=A0ABV6JSE2_9PROT
MKQEQLLQTLARHKDARWRPATFAERGACVTFTTPTLLGSRVHMNDDAVGTGGLELMVPNPSGGEGVYVLPWGALPDIYALTLHDRHAWRRLAQTGSVTPPQVRAVLREVAVAGYAGRAAARAAAAAAEAEQASREVTRRALIYRLLQQSGARFPDQPGAAGGGLAAALERMTSVAAWPEQIYAAIGTLAELLEPLGLPEDRAGGRLPQRLLDLHAMSKAMRAATTNTEDERNCVLFMTDAVRHLISLARPALTAGRTLMEDAADLLAQWLRDPVPVQRKAAQAEWLLDGWELVLALWQVGGLASLRDLVRLVPMMPVEAEELVPLAERVNLPWADEFQRRMMTQGRDWRASAVLDVNRRNERLRAVAA